MSQLTLAPVPWCSGLAYVPVKDEIAGSNPVGTADLGPSFGKGLSVRGAPALALALVIALASCGGRAVPPADPVPRVELVTAEGTTVVRVEIAETPEARQRGLMGRTSLDEDAGMLFIWPQDATSSFHMKDTLVPLSVAFIAADGTILRILDMEPCRADPCQTYDPRIAYRMALEVGRGAFEQWGVREADRARLVRN